MCHNLPWRQLQDTGRQSPAKNTWVTLADRSAETSPEERGWRPWRSLPDTGGSPGPCRTGLSSCVSAPGPGRWPLDWQDSQDFPGSKTKEVRYSLITSYYEFSDIICFSTQCCGKLLLKSNKKNICSHGFKRTKEEKISIHIFIVRTSCNDLEN